MDKSNWRDPAPKRLLSLDALRGFNMFWIIGADRLAEGLRDLGIPAAGILADQLTHAGWTGFHFYDLVFPMFIFLSGVSIPFSLGKRLESGQKRGRIIRATVRRALLLYALGILYYGGLAGVPFPAGIRFVGVLQRIAVCYLLASLLYLAAGPRAQAGAAAGILAGYWLIMRFVPVPGFGAGDWSVEGNLASYLDRLLLPGRLYYETWDPEGLLSTLPAVANCLMGVCAGQWLRAGGWTALSARKAGGLFSAGAVLSLLGLVWGQFFPINKSLWTSSYALLAGGLSAALLALFYWLIDLRGWRAWAFPFAVIGMNSIAIYIGVELIPFAELAGRLAGGDLAAAFGPGRTLFLAAVQLLLEWAVLYWMYKRKIFIRL